MQGRGLVVITSCGHVGLINTIKAAMAVSKIDKPHPVLSGFHLAPAPLDYVEHTIDVLEADPIADQDYPRGALHCDIDEAA